MIIWLTSYPKNGNTWLRSLISAYYYTKDGIFLGDKHLKNVQQFPVKKYFEDQTALLGNVNVLLKQAQDPLKAIQSMQLENASLKKELASLNKLKSKVLKNELMEELKIPIK